VCNYAHYLVESALPEYSMLKHTYSKIAAAAVYATSKSFGRCVCVREHVHAVNPNRPLVTSPSPTHC
jgi:hypothetical protein